jgi:hypothetical protein
MVLLGAATGLRVGELLGLKWADVDFEKLAINVARSVLKQRIGPEVGYLTCTQDAANVLFHVVNNRYLRKRPMIFTTNKPLNEWGNVLHDEDLAAAILGRVLERGRFIRLDGPSGRTRHLKLEDPPASGDGVFRARRPTNMIAMSLRPVIIVNIQCGLTFIHNCVSTAQVTPIGGIMSPVGLSQRLSG